MSSGSLLLVLLVLGCLQSFTEANNAKTPEQCCFKFQTNKIPLRLIKGYKETRLDCTKAGIVFILNNGRRVCADPGLLFTLNKGRRVCADPGVEWVKNIMEIIDRRLFT
ncbi:C-C motif chemokine 3 isoform X1 [Ictalurus punctatus]|uniref:C-C motif chemokine n=1 Tax=Ictalurus punctatus TaxID=7998 RepID=A0A9F7RJ31_ICTPU|nr:C-C motif chemokine 3 isoform X1 [Ictalurus punctatus]